MFDRLQSVITDKSSELRVVADFFNKFDAIESNYKADLMDFCVSFQAQICEAFSDEKMQQFFQMIFNNLLKRCNQITRSQDCIKGLNLKLGAVNDDLRQTCQVTTQALQRRLADYRRALGEWKIGYSKYLDGCNALNQDAYRRKTQLQNEVDDAENMRNQLETTRDRDQQLKLAVRLVNFRLDIGKDNAQQIKEAFREQFKKRKWTSEQADRFDGRWESLLQTVQRRVSSLRIRNQIQQKAVVTGAEAGIDEHTRDQRARFDGLGRELFACLDEIDASVRGCSLSELEWKDKLKAQIMQFMYDYFPGTCEQTLRKAKSAEQNMEGFSSKFAGVQVN